MTKLQAQVKEFMLKAGQSCPEKPAEPSEDIRVLRVRLILEEALEFAKASGVSIEIDQTVQSSEYPCPEGALSMDDLSFEVVSGADIIEVADAIADLNYVSQGAALSYGLDMEPIEEAVHENNMTKFLDGYIDENGKLRKGPSYKSVDLTELVDKQIKNND